MPLSHMPLSRSLTNVTLSTKARRNKRRGGRRGAKRKASAAARGDFITVPGGGGEDIQISAPDHFEVGCVIEDLVRQLPELLEEMRTLAAGISVDIIAVIVQKVVEHIVGAEHMEGEEIVAADQIMTGRALYMPETWRYDSAPPGGYAWRQIMAA